MAAANAIAKGAAAGLVGLVYVWFASVRNADRVRRRKDADRR